MEHLQVMEILSQCGLGAVLVAADGLIVTVNETGDHLLHGNGKLPGKKMQEIAPLLFKETGEPLYENIDFNEYLLRVPAPEIELPEGLRMIVFRNASNDACHDMLISILNQTSEAVALFDAKGRLWHVNDSVVRMEDLIARDVLGEPVETIYQSQDDDLIIPRVLQTKKAVNGLRQHYQTRFGKQIDCMTNSYPFVQNGQLLGAFTIMEDWKLIGDMQKQIMELQEKLLARTRKGNHEPANALAAKYSFRDIHYASDTMRELVELCQRVAKNDSSVMIYGETGTGKELFAQSIHNASPRANGPFLAINCAAIPENLLESLLFGTEKGAYTGAEKRPGLFEQANGGSLFLDELNSMNINLQSKLLRVLQEGVFRRVGGTEELTTNVRILSALNIPPYQAVSENKLRIDLLYRLGVVTIPIPPLRDRREDISLLSKSFIIRYNQKLTKNVTDIHPATRELFEKYHWPGNVRELQHAIEHAMNVLPDTHALILPEHLPAHIQTEPTARIKQPALGERGSLQRKIKDTEYKTVCAALRRSGGNISAAAKALGMSRQNLQYRIRRYQIDIIALLEEGEAP